MGSPLSSVAQRRGSPWVSWRTAGPSQPGFLSQLPSLLLDVAAVCEACCDLHG